VKLSDFRNLDPQNAGAWPDGVKYVFCGLLFALILFLGWWWMIGDQSTVLEQKQKQETALKSEFHDKQLKVVNLEKLKAQLDDMREILRQMLRQLPSKTEMPELLDDVSRAGSAAGLDVQLFQPGPETIQDGFYAEKPITVRMIGTYHQFGTFISTVAALQRVIILTLHDVSLKPIASSGKPGLGPDQLALEGTVKTYRYVDESEVEANKPAAGKSAKAAK
jgi:type IV pilus assembly protein PilO